MARKRSGCDARFRCTTSTLSVSSICETATSNASSSWKVRSRSNSTARSMSLRAVAEPSACEPNRNTPSTRGSLAKNNFSAGVFCFSTRDKLRFISCYFTTDCNCRKKDHRPQTAGSGRWSVVCGHRFSTSVTTFSKISSPSSTKSWPIINAGINRSVLRPQPSVSKPRSKQRLTM